MRSVARQSHAGAVEKQEKTPVDEICVSPTKLKLLEQVSSASVEGGTDLTTTDISVVPPGVAPTLTLDMIEGEDDGNRCAWEVEWNGGVIGVALESAQMRRWSLRADGTGMVLSSVGSDSTSPLETESETETETAKEDLEPEPETSAAAEERYQFSWTDIQSWNVLGSTALRIHLSPLATVAGLCVDGDEPVAVELRTKDAVAIGVTVGLMAEKAKTAFCVQDQRLVFVDFDPGSLRLCLTFAHLPHSDYPEAVYESV